MQTINLEQLVEEFFEEVKYKLGFQSIYTPHETEEDVDIEIKNILDSANENDDHKEVISAVIDSIKYGSRTDVEIVETTYSELRDMEKFVIKLAYLSRLLYRFGEDVVAKGRDRVYMKATLKLQEKFPIDTHIYGYKLSVNFHKYCVVVKQKFLEPNFGWLSSIVDVDKIIVGYTVDEDIYDKYKIKFKGFNVNYATAITTKFKLEFEDEIDNIIEMLLNRDNLEIENLEPIMEKVHSILA